MMRSRVFLCVPALLAITGCSIASSVPWPTSSYSLNAEAVAFMRGAPTADLTGMTDQALRSGQSLPESEIVVGVSGGGARATAFTLGVLAELESLGEWTSTPRQVNALREVDHFSTVSGGGWGVAAYLADRYFSTQPASYRLSDNLSSIGQTFLNTVGVGGNCLPRRLDGITRRNGRALLMRDILEAPTSGPSIPYLFVNATIETNQHPFLFTPQFSRYYRIDSFDFCDRTVRLDAAESFGSVEVSEAVATSGSVPGFYHSSAHSAICSPGSNMTASFFCSQGKVEYDEMTLVDGGIYDNHGYRTAIEVLRQGQPMRKRVLLMIDTNADTELPFHNMAGRSNRAVLVSTGSKAGFPARTAAYQRTFDYTTEVLGIRAVQLDFAAAAGVRDTLLSDGRNLLAGLEMLSNHARTEINCFDESGTYLVAKKYPGSLWAFPDCRENNFYRTGLLHKTTYHFDAYYHSLLVELGRLVVRLHADEIYETIYGSTT